MEKKVKIAYCTWTDPRDKRSWSGTHHFIMKALSDIGEVEILGPLSNKWLVPVKIVNKLLNIVFKKRISVKHTPLIAKEYARQLEKKLKGETVDYIFCPAGSEVISYLKTDTPIIYLSDATFASMIDYYPGFCNLLNISTKWGMEVERRAIENASKVIYSSDWAADSAVKEYGCDRGKISVIPFGANIENPPSKEEIIKIRKEPINKFKLLWVGVDWERKGGQIAYDAMVELNNRGVDSELIVCGCAPPIDNPYKGLRREGFLNKNVPEQFEKLKKLYKEANVFMFPSKQECSAISLAEACCYGLPILTFDTGGLANYVVDNINGYRMGLEEGCQEFSDKLKQLNSDGESYQRLAAGSRAKYDDDLNWSKWRECLYGNNLF